MAASIQPGQRYISNAEPELGLGTILRVEGRQLQVLFAKTGVLRQYAIQSAPLTRASFRVGDRISGHGVSLVVESVEERDGLLVYRGSGRELGEGSLDDVQNVSKADERLISGRIDANDAFDLRVEALRRRADARRDPGYGVLSARIGLIPHQLRVAEIASQRRPPRFLLADEVGLGKTIEAGLVLARAVASGRATRVLVLVPEALTYQWFVELLRRFNLSFSIFDDERVEAIAAEGTGRNPFADEQLILTDIGFVLRDPKRADLLAAAGFDLLVVDEAHHLAWSPEQASPEYALVERLAAQTPGVLLLTATPEQLGRSGHFARLRLLDPSRFHDLDAYQAEAHGYVELSQLAERLLSDEALTPADTARLRDVLAGDDESLALIDRHDEPEAREELLRRLIDRHGTGRVMFRNRRAIVGGFPARVPHLVRIPRASVDDATFERYRAEFLKDLAPVERPVTEASVEKLVKSGPARGAITKERLRELLREALREEEASGALSDSADEGIDDEPAVAPPSGALSYANDARLEWLVALLDEFPVDKFLLICRSQEKLFALEEGLRTRSGVKVARFHEGLGLVQRDRNAAFFADPEGARLLLCTEIGSEGRNFQFAHHLIVWDLPLDPDVLEQRIGRLDRIGQAGDVNIHACVIEGSAQDALLRWYDEGLGAFRSSPEDGRELLKRFGDEVKAVALAAADGAPDASSRLDDLVARTAATHAELAEAIAQGRDRLLELSTRYAEHADALRDSLANADADEDAESFMLRLFEHYGIEADEMGPHTVSLDPEMLSTEALPGFESGPRAVTFARDQALTREELALLRLDHPLVAGAIDLLLSSEGGNATFLIDDALPPRSALLEAVFVLECVAPPGLAIERFLPPMPVRVVIDTRRAERENYAPDARSVVKARDRGVDLSKSRKVLSTLVPPMLAAAEAFAEKRAKREIDRALDEARRVVGGEIDRLETLAKVNPSVRSEEIANVRKELAAIEALLPESRARLDAVRFVASADFLAIRA